MNALQARTWKRYGKETLNKSPEPLSLLSLIDKITGDIDRAQDNNNVWRGECHLKIKDIRQLMHYARDLYDRTEELQSVGGAPTCHPETTTPTLSPSDKPNITAIDADGNEWVTCAQKSRSLGLAYSTVAGYRNRWQTTINNPFSTHADAYLIRADEPKPPPINRRK